MKDLTLIILSYNRPLELKKKILLYKDKYHLLILDKSDLSIASFFKSNCNKKSKYLHLPNKSFLERIVISRKFIKTKYITMLTDDDYFFPNYFEKSVNFLNLHKNYSCVGGYVFSFRKFLNLFYLQRITANVADIKNENYLERVKKVLNKNYSQIFHGIIRSSIYKDYASLTRKNLKYYKNHTFWFFHLEMCMLIALSGKIKIFNQIFFIRNSSFPRRIWPEITDHNLHIKILKKFKEGYFDYWQKNLLIIRNKFNNYNFRYLKKELLDYFNEDHKRQKKRYKNFKKNLGLFNYLIKLIPEIFKEFVYVILGKYGERFNLNWFKKNKILKNKKTIQCIYNLQNYFNENYLNELIKKKK